MGRHARGFHSNGMATTPTSTTTRAPSRDGIPQGSGVLLSAADFDVLIGELGALRRAAASANAAPSPSAQHDARVSAGAQELLAALERAGVERGRIDQVEALIELASTLGGVAASR